MIYFISSILFDLLKIPVHERPQIGTDVKQPRRKALLRPRWPEEFIIEPVHQCKYALVALETASVGPKAIKVIDSS